MVRLLLLVERPPHLTHEETESWLRQELVALVGKPGIRRVSLSRLESVSTSFARRGDWLIELDCTAAEERRASHLQQRLRATVWRPPPDRNAPLHRAREPAGGGHHAPAELMGLAIVIFVAALAAIATERVGSHQGRPARRRAGPGHPDDRSGDAIESIDFNTIGLLAGMMLMVGLTETTGAYTWLAIHAGQLSRGQPAAVVASLALTTAVLSAFLDNLTTVLLLGA